MPIEALTTVDPNQFFDLRSTSHGVGRHRLETGVSGVALSNDFSGRLRVTTAEGDTIRLSTDLETDFRVGRYYGYGGSEAAAVRIGAESVQYGLQRDFGITIDGELNKQEQSDLDKLLQKLSGIFHGFVEGQDEKALVQTASIADQFRGLGTLSSLDLNVEVVRSVTVVAASTYTPGGAPAVGAAIPQLSNGTMAPTPSLDPFEDGELTGLGNDTQLASLLQQVFDALKEAETELQKFQKYLPNFFERLHEDLVRQFEKRANPKEEAHEQSVEPLPSQVTSQDLLTVYSSVDFETVSFSVQG